LTRRCHQQPRFKAPSGIGALPAVALRRTMKVDHYGTI
jgi:hypothetical protein